MVPDWAAVADPQTGYNTLINGQWEVIGGTSAVAPLLAGFLNAVNGARIALGLPKISQFGPLLWGAASSFLDITSGNNGTYSATIGPDPCSGLGRPLGTLFSILTGSQTPPPINPPPVNPPPTVPPTSNTLFTMTFNKAVKQGGRVTFSAPVAIPTGTYNVTPVTTSSQDTKKALPNVDI
jgi:kumamolisin